METSFYISARLIESTAKFVTTAHAAIFVDDSKGSDAVVGTAFSVQFAVKAWRARSTLALHKGCWQKMISCEPKKL